MVDNDDAPAAANAADSPLRRRRHQGGPAPLPPTALAAGSSAAALARQQAGPWAAAARASIAAQVSGHGFASPFSGAAAAAAAASTSRRSYSSSSSSGGGGGGDRREPADGPAAAAGPPPRLAPSLFLPALPDRVTIVEVGPRDGLQNEPGVIPTSTKIRFIELLADAGLRAIEATSFVSPKWVPQLADADEVMRAVKRSRGGGGGDGFGGGGAAGGQAAAAPSSPPSSPSTTPVRFTALTPNLKGFERAVAAGADEVAIFGAASEAFSRRNINCSIDESLSRFRAVAEAAKERGVPVRGYVSCAVHCPYSGDVAPEEAARVARALLDMGCYEVSLGDTTGRGTPRQVAAAVRATVAAGVPLAKIAAHLHDTYGQALANALAALQQGVRVFDASAGGLGGCPYSPGASGNVATEDLVYMLSGLGVEHGVDLPRLVGAAAFISRALGRAPASHVARAMAAQQEHEERGKKGEAEARRQQQQQEGCAVEARRAQQQQQDGGGVEADEGGGSRRRPRSTTEGIGAC